jgi:4,5:9,10-diseco-3-hydroxy-5,9,17-trioxoandrosta-1(10),2-diene-4-oate hydrolase
MNPPKDQYIKVGDINTRYWAGGEQGPTVVLVHGVGRFIEDWLPCFSKLASRYCIYAIDLLGHGHTDKPLSASYSIVDLARFLNEFITTLGMKRAHIIGHSLGGGITLQLTLQFPEVVDKLVLVCSAGLGKEATLVLRIATVPVLGELLTRPSRSGTKRLLKEFVEDPDILTDDLVDTSFQMASAPGAQKILLKTLRAAGNLFGQHKEMYGPIVENLSSIHHPALVIWGQQDRVLPVDHAKVAAQGLPDVRIEILDGCGHMPMLEQTELFNTSILDFLGR